MNKTKKIIFISLILALVLSIGIFIKYRELTKTEYISTFSNDIIVKIPIPQGSKLISEYGSNVVEFTCSKDVNEVEQFYDTYLDTLQLVHYTHDDKYIAYYDSQQNIVITQINTFMRYGNTTFIITYDLYDEDSWIIIQPD